MADEFIGLELGGEVTLRDLAKALTAFDGLVKAISREVEGGEKIKWTITGLSLNPEAVREESER